MGKADKIISKKDIIVPKGTIFININNSTSRYMFDNYVTEIELDKDTCARVIVSSENKEYFEYKKEK